ncbi:ureidoglycolate lyase [Leptolyngbya cf. ectocarpi LEGE 11479]|uniref:Ureidoglycolate lyase n=1 Tax=Leptolyngbya cf. ectocarpi LEGE 11479 TaxID=1828722 RepID=A0A928ZTV7_LEPEC|nr:ureidoglycolate lyase [Leptolyngbya ectocarpi]MBE9067353.1 ureidoglycolate lyase [Leptolyngbya cf. ectocarpi LEGE 11479]
MKINQLIAHPLTAEAFRPFGQVLGPQHDGKAYDTEDAQLKLDGGIPRFYIMQLERKGTRFERITRHLACTQCLGSLEGKEWLMAVAPPCDGSAPDPEQIQAFKIPGDCFIKLGVGTWHAGPLFETDVINFYNLELSDTNVVDHDTCNLEQTYGLAFDIVD